MGSNWDNKQAGDTGGNIYVFNASTGATIWSYPVRNDVHSSAAIVDGVVYFGSDDGNFYAIGKPLLVGPPLSASTFLITLSILIIVAIIVIAVFLNYRKKLTMY